MSAAAIAAASSGVSFPCSAMLFDDRGAPILELAQVGQALVERAQLRVVEPAGGFLAIAGDEGHGGLVVEQRDRGVDLGHTNAETRQRLAWQWGSWNGSMTAVGDILRARRARLQGARAVQTSDRGNQVVRTVSLDAARRPGAEGGGNLDRWASAAVRGWGVDGRQPIWRPVIAMSSSRWFVWSRVSEGARRVGRWHARLALSRRCALRPPERQHQRH